ncbi:MAG: hypothetical protein ACOC1K_05465 [Nanoarchaeota archaeon]
MEKKIKLVAESLSEYTKSGTTLNEAEQLNESAKGQLQKFIKNPEKTAALTSAFAKQLGKTKGLKDAILKMETEKQVKLAKQALGALEADPKKAFPWLQIKGGKIIGAGALGAQKSQTGKDLGQ